MVWLRGCLGIVEAVQKGGKDCTALNFERGENKAYLTVIRVSDSLSRPGKYTPVGICAADSCVQNATAPELIPNNNNTASR